MAPDGNADINADRQVLNTAPGADRPDFRTLKLVEMHERATLVLFQHLRRPLCFRPGWSRQLPVHQD